jgi:hypothetical protein
MQQRRLAVSLASFVLVGLWATACGGDSDSNNQVPVVTGPTVQSADVTSGTAVALSLEATDADGDSLTYEWVQTPASPAGTFSDATLPNPTWTAPTVTSATSFQLGVAVSDGKGGTTRRSVTVLVRPRPPENRVPVVAAGTPNATPTSVTGSVPVQLSLSATDPDGDTLTYTWSQEPATPVGSFSNLFVSSPSWTSPVVTTPTTFTLKVTITDDRGGSTQAQVEVPVAPPSANNRAPTLTTDPTASARDINGQQSVNLSVTASDLDGDTLTYTWSQLPSSPAGVFSSTSVANPSWTAPSVTVNTSFQFRVTVTDGKGGSVSGTTAQVTVHAPVNHAPTISQAAQADPSSITGSGPVQLSVVAMDTDGDTPIYAWTQMPTSPAGTFANASSANPTWTSPTVSTTTSFTLKVNVSDGRGGSVQSQVDVSVAPPVPQNNPPVVSAPTATPNVLNYQESTALAVTASDPDGDTPTYAWTQTPASPAGTFSSTTSATPTWTAPRVNTNTQFQLRVTVSDGRGGTNSNTVPVMVNAFANTSPTLTAGPSASSTTINEQETVNLSVSASDADGDPLTYAWSQTSPASPVGTFSSTSSATPTWTAPDVTASGTYTLRVVVSDGQGGSVSGTVNISVQKVNQAPNVGASISGPSTLLAGNTGTFSISASDPDGDPLTYSWSQTSPATQGTFVGSSTSSSAQWYSPVVTTQTSFTLSVSVTDGQSAPVVRTLTVPVTVPNYSSDVRGVWTLGGCTSCHGTSGGLDLTPTNPAAMVNVAAVAACSPAAPARVVPSDPDNSVLIRKMEGTSCGSRMPRNNPSYFTNNPGLVIRVRSWILAGAPAN